MAESRIGVHAYIFSAGETADDWRQIAGGARAAGFGIVEVPLLDARRVDVKPIRAALEAAGLSVTCSAGLTAATDISSGDPAALERGEAALLRAVEAAADVGAELLSGVLYSSLQGYDGPPTARGRENSAAVLARVARAAAARWITIGIEPVNRYETNLLNTAAQALAFIEAVGESNVVLHLDTFHMNIEEGDMAAPVLEAGPRLGYVHVGESHRGALGTGTVDFDAFFGALRQIEYEGPIVFESFTASVPRGELASALHVWRDLWDEPGALAGAAAEFVHARLGDPDTTR